MTAAEQLLARLERVRSRGTGQWSASCPGPLHERGDRSASLSIREIDDRVLLYCFAGCGAGEIVAAVGLSLGDLFQRRLTSSSIEPVRTPPFPVEMARRLRHNATILKLATRELKRGVPLSESDQRAMLAAYREIEQIVSATESWPRRRT